MAATINDNAPQTAVLSPRASSGEGIGTHPAISRRNPSPPWNQVVLGPEAGAFPVSPTTPSVVEEESSGQGKIESLTEGFESETQQEGSDNGNGNGNGNGSKKLAWNKPSNGGPEIGLGPVMGAVSWPSLSESTKASPKADSSKSPSDAPVSEPQVTASASTVALPSQVSQASASQRQMGNNNSSPNPSGTTQHHGRPARQKSMKGGGSSSSNGGFSHQPPPQSSLVGEASHDNNSSVKPALGGSDGSGRDHHVHNNAYREGGQRGGGEHPQHRHYRRNNSGPNLRGDGSFGNRRDQDRANHEWNHQRSFNGRDNTVPPQRAGPRGGGFIRPQPGAAPYIAPPIGPYSNPMSMPSEMQPLYYLAPHSGMPFVAQMPPRFFTPPFDPQLRAKILHQIDYYFSNENLIRDTFLRRNMDEHGWVPVQLIASFNKVTQLTTNVQLILDVVRSSALVEVQGDKLRKRDDWMRWLMPPSVHPNASGSQSPRVSGQDPLALHMQGLAVDEKSVSKSNSSGQLDIHARTSPRSSSGEANLHLETSKDGSSSNGH